MQVARPTNRALGNSVRDLCMPRFSRPMMIVRRRCWLDWLVRELYDVAECVEKRRPEQLSTPKRNGGCGTAYSLCLRYLIISIGHLSSLLCWILFLRLEKIQNLKTKLSENHSHSYRPAVPPQQREAPSLAAFVGVVWSSKLEKTTTLSFDYGRQCQRNSAIDHEPQYQ